MRSEPEIASLERLDLTAHAAKGMTPEEFLASFDLSLVPTGAGCYLMCDAEGAVIYVGKAKNLRARVRAYINESDSRYRVKFLMQRVARIDFLVTTNEKEALLLENSLIKKHHPRYNVRLRDDKTYVSLRVDVKHEFPRVTVTRKIKKDGARYFGPYSSAQAVRETVRQLQKVFPLRTCSDNVLHNRTRPCLYYQMGQCTAPCVGYIDAAAYGEIVEQVLLMLEGRSDELERMIRRRIQEHADKLEFEKAAVLRDRLHALEKTMERQRMVRTGSSEDRDVFGVYTQGRFSEIQVLFFRGGKMTGGRAFSFGHQEMPIEEVFGSFLLQYYAEGAALPPEVVVPVVVDDADVLEEILTEQRGTKVEVACPQRGDKRALVDLANRNAKSSFDEKRLAEKANKDVLELARQKLSLAKTPERIECFDISTTQGAKAVGSMVTFEGGLPSKPRYRKFSIRTVEGQDDFAMMREILLRRYQRAIDEDDLPDLTLIDGGKGQLNVATTVFKDLGIEDLPAVGIAKSRTLEEGEHSPERFFLPGQKNPIILPQNSPVVHLLARIRDEAHRFAITYHKKRRAKSTLATALTEIPGVGENRARVLLRELGSLAQIRCATVDALAALPGFNRKLAETVKSHLAAVAVAEGEGPETAQ